MNVLRFELKIQLKSTLTWAISLAVLGFAFIAIFPAYTSDVDTLKELLANYPPEFLKAAGLGNAGIDTFNGFYSFCFVYLIFMGAIQSLILGITIISKEKTRKTSDFLFTKPVNRLRILIEKIVTSLICVIFTNIVYVIATYLATTLYVDQVDWKVFFLLQGALLGTQILFLAIGFFLACCFNKIKSPVSLGIGVGALFFALEMVANMYNDTALKYISPMSYLNPSYIVDHSSYELSTFITGSVLTILLLGAGLYLYKVKDINS